MADNTTDKKIIGIIIKTLERWILKFKTVAYGEIIH